VHGVIVRGTYIKNVARYIKASVLQGGGTLYLRVEFNVRHRHVDVDLVFILRESRHMRSTRVAAFLASLIGLPSVEGVSCPLSILRRVAGNLEATMSTMPHRKRKRFYFHHGCLFPPSGFSVEIG